MPNKKIGEILVEAGLINKEQLDISLEEAKRNSGVRLGSIIVKNGFASELDIAQTLAFQLELPFLDLSNDHIDREATKLISEKIASKHICIPISREGKVLRLAISDPLNFYAVDDVRFSTGYSVQLCVSTFSDIVNAINKHYHLSEPLEAFVLDAERDQLVKDKYVELLHEAEFENDLTDQVKKSAAPPIVKLVDSIIIHAVTNRANDIHLEPQEKNLVLRIRVDGIMRETMHFPSKKALRGS